MPVVSDLVSDAFILPEEYSLEELQEIPLLHHQQSTLWITSGVLHGTHIRPRKRRAQYAAGAAVLGVATIFAVLCSLFPDLHGNSDIASARIKESLLLLTSIVDRHQTPASKMERVTQLSHMARMGGEWGLVNPQTGALRLQCGDSVAYGRYFHGKAFILANSPF